MLNGTGLDCAIHATGVNQLPPPTEHTEAELVGHSDVTPNPELTPDLYLKWRTTADEIHRILGAIRIDAITLPPNVYCFDSFKPERAEIAIADVANVYAGEGNTIAVSTFLGRTYRINAESGERAEEIRCTLVRLVQLYRRLQFQRVIYNLWGDEDTQWASIPPDSVRMKWPHTLPLSQYNPPLSSNKSA